MAANAKIIKHRIKSIANTKKITKAMELVAASKMRRAISSVLGTRPYAKLSWETINAVTRAIGEGVTHPLLEENTDADKILVVLFSSDRGLAGAYNVSMARAVAKKIKTLDSKVEAISVGKKGARELAKLDVPIVASFEGLTNKPLYKDILPITSLILEEYEKGTYKKVIIAFTDFISAISQKPEFIELLPLGQPEDSSGLGNTNEKTEDLVVPEAKEYTFEPNPQQVLNQVLPRLMETMVYQALLESAASEHSSRMMAMRNASDAAQDMLEDLTFTYNQIRQAGITQEIAEISSGKAALE